MPDLENATSVIDGSEQDLKELLGGETAEAPATEEESEQPADAKEVEVVDGEEAAAGEGEEHADEEGSDEEASGDEEAADEEEAGELELDESDHDYSQAAYERAAKIFSRNLKLPADQSFDPSNAKDRAALKEMMDRGQNFKTLTQELEQAKAGKGDDKKDAAGDADSRKDAVQQLTPEQQDRAIDTFISQANDLAKASLIPKVSMHFATSVIEAQARALWGKEYKPGSIKLTQEEADSITTGYSAGFNMLLQQSAGMIVGGVREAMFADPSISNAINVTTKEIGLQTVGELKDAKGNLAYPDLEELVESGRLKAVYQANPALQQIKAGDGRDPAKNYAAQVEAAIKIARGEGATRNVSAAVETGKKQAELRHKKLGASRVAAGNTKGIRKGESYAERTANEIVSGGGNKFESAVERDAPMRRK